MGMFDMFTSKPVVPGAPQTPAAQQQAAANGNPMVPNAGNSPVSTDLVTGVEAVSPLQDFADLWQAPDPASTPKSVPLFNLDAKKLQEAAGKINFSQVLTKEDMTAIAAGGEGAVTAFQNSMNRVAQATFAQSAATTTKLIEQALTRNTSDLESRIPSLIKKQSVSEANKLENPLFSNPATAPIMSALEQQFQTKYPNATAAEITAHTKNYLEEFVGLATAPANAAAAAKKAKSEPDWTSFLEE